MKVVTSDYKQVNSNSREMYSITLSLMYVQELGFFCVNIVIQARCILN